MLSRWVYILNQCDINNDINDCTEYKTELFQDNKDMLLNWKLN